MWDRFKCNIHDSQEKLLQESVIKRQTERTLGEETYLPFLLKDSLQFWPYNYLSSLFFPLKRGHYSLYHGSFVVT